MHQLISHFSGNFSSPFLERFLAFNTPTTPSIIPGSVSVHEKTNTENQDPSTTAKQKEKLTGDIWSTEKLKNVRDSVGRNRKEAIVKNILEIEDYEKYKEGMDHVNNGVRLFFKRKGVFSMQKIKNINKKIEKLENPLSILPNNDKIKKLDELTALKIEIQKKLDEEVKTEANRLWREKFPESSGVMSFTEIVETLLLANLPVNPDTKRFSAEHSKYYPDKDAGQVQDYVRKRADVILIEADGKHMKHVQNGEPFNEVIQFVKDSNAGKKVKLSLAGRRLIKQIQSPSIKKDFEKDTKRGVKKVQKLNNKGKSGKNKESDEKFNKKVRAHQSAVMLSESTYQLAMMQIAEDADTIIKKDSENPLYKLTPEQESALEAIVPHGYMVQNSFTPKYKDGATQSLGIDKVTLENFMLYEVLGTWGVLTVLANLLVAYKSGKIEEALPYIAGGLGATYLATDMVFNHTLDKRREPEKMAKWIWKEKDNDHYQDFFEDEDEMTLWSNISWPQKSGERGMKNSLKGIRKAKDKTIDGKTEDEQENIKKSIPSIDQRKTLDPKEFAKGGRLEEYLPDFVMTSSGATLSKEVFIKNLDARRGKAKKNSMRYDMFKKTLSRLGDNDSYIPHLNSLHNQALMSKENKQTEKTNSSKSTTSEKNPNLYVGGPKNPNTTTADNKASK